MLSSLNTLAGSSILFPKKYPISPPANLIISSITETTISIQYDYVPAADNYVITTSPPTTTVNTTLNTHTLTGLTSGVLYTVYVRSQSTIKNSLSSPVSVSDTTGVKTIVNVNATASLVAGSNTVFIFNGTSGFYNFGNIISSNGISTRVFAVAGGGGGGAGYDNGGGGGGGGVVDLSFLIQGNNWLGINMGAGGVGGDYGIVDTMGSAGLRGGNTTVNFGGGVFANVVAMGGGAGGEYSLAGSTGGSGGGAGYGNVAVATGNTTLNNNASSGGKYVSGGGSAGGGGAGSAGSDASGGLGGAGGAGYQSSITGSSLYWGGGGGGVSIAGNGSTDSASFVGPSVGSFSILFSRSSNQNINAGANTYLISSGTVEAWIRNVGTFGSNQLQTIIGVVWRYIIQLRENRLMVYDWGIGGTAGFIEPTPAITITDGKWHHVALAFQHNIPNGTKLYYDGALVHTFTYTPGTVAPGNFAIGGWTGGQTFSGYIDEARIWSTVRTDAQILNNYNIQISPTTTGLIGYWTMNEGFGTYVYNQVSDQPTLRFADSSTLPTWVQNQRYSAVYAPSVNKIYSFPEIATIEPPIPTVNVLILDVSSLTFTSISNTSSYRSAVYAPNGKIYALRSTTDTSTNILVVDTLNNDNITTITGISNGSSATAWENGVLAPNGNIYFVPRASSSVLIVNTALDTASTSIITGLTGANYWMGGVLGQNGKIYCAPLDSSFVMTIDTTTNTANQTAIFVGSGTNKWNYGVAGPNGEVFFFPQTRGRMLAINTYNDTVDSSFAFTNNSAISGALAPNGKIYCSPQAATSPIVIDPMKNDVSSVVLLPNTQNLQLWFDANDFSSLELSGNQLLKWKDKSGFGRDATLYDLGTIRNTYGATNYNGRPGIQFVYNQGFSAPLPAGTLLSGATFFVVFQKNGGAANEEGLISRTTGNRPNPFDIVNEFRLFGNATTPTSQVFVVSPLNIKQSHQLLNILSASITVTDPSNSFYEEWLNSSSSPPMSSSSIAKTATARIEDSANLFFIGTRENRGSQFNGVIAEILVYNRTMTTNERQQIESYLIQKWYIWTYSATVAADNGILYGIPNFANKFLRIVPSLPTIASGAAGGLGGGGGGAVVNYFGSSVGGGSGGGSAYSSANVGGNSVVVPIVGGGHGAAGTGGGGGGGTFKDAIATINRTINTPNGTVVGTATFTNDCPVYSLSVPLANYIQKSMYFNGSTYVSLGNPSNYAFNEGTYECMFEAPVNGTGLRALIAKAGVYGLYLDASSRLVAGYYYNSNSRVLMNVDASFVNDNLWHHAAMTFTSSNVVNLYLDGILKRSALVNYAVSFSGSNYVTAGASYNSYAIGTIEAWIRNVSTPTGDRIIFGVRPKFVLYLTNNIFGTYDYGGNAARTTSITIDNSNTTWHHIALVFEFGTTNNKIYYDGVPVLTNFSMTAGGTANSFDVGSTSQFSTSGFIGLIDDVRIWNIRRSDADILADYNRIISSTTSGLTGYWLFNENTGTSIANQVSGGPSLTFVNSPSWYTGRPTTQTTSPIQIGADNSANLFTGSIANARVWNVARSATDISANRVRVLRNCDVATDGLHGSYPLNDVSSVITNCAPRIGGYGGSGAVAISVPTANIFKKNNFGLVFRGSTGAIQCASAASEFALNSGTIDCWIKTANAGSGLRALVVKPNAYGLYLNNGVVGVFDFSASTFITSSINVANNQWRNIRFIFNDRVPNGSTLYIDRVLSATFTYPIMNQSGILGLRNNPSSTSQGFLGQIYNVRIWNYAFTSFTTTSRLSLSPEMGLVGSWPLNEGVNTAVYNYATVIVPNPATMPAADFSWNAISPADYAPTQLGVVDITETTATLNFQMNGYAVSYDITTVPTTSTWNITNNTFQFTGLTAGTNYTVNVYGVDKYGERSAVASSTFKTFSNTTYYYKFDVGDFSNNLGIVNYKSGTTVYDANVVNSSNNNLNLVSPISSSIYQVGTGSLNLVNPYYLSLPAFTTTLTGFSAAFWVRGGIDASNACIFDFGQTDASNVLSARFVSGLPRLFMNQLGSTNSYNIGSVSLVDNSWNHIAWSIAPSTGVWTAYLNSVPLTTGVSAYPTTVSRTANYIGKYITDTSNTRLSVIYVDDFRSFNSAIDSTQVANLYYGRTFV